MPTLEDLIAHAPDESFDHPNGRAASSSVLGAEISQGERNATLASLAGSMRRKGASQEAIASALRVENVARCRPPLEDKEVEKIARSVSRYEPAPQTTTSTSPTPATEPWAESLKEVALDIDARPPEGFLASPVWPADAYGILGAEDKAGKTWLQLDFAVSVASGTPWLGRFECEPGAALLFLGEGGRRKMLRRLRAIASARGLVAEDLPIRVRFRAPHLTSKEHLQKIAAELEAHPARLVVLDPLYLAARGANGSDLYAMGEHLSNLQDVVQNAGAALVVSTHYNKTGEGRGPKRFTGVGPGAWGRVLVSADVRHRRTTDERTGETLVVLDVAFTGDEIGDTHVTVARRVWVEDPGDLTSLMHYTTEILDNPPPVESATPGMSPAARRVLEVLRREAGEINTRTIGDRLADENTYALKQRTIQEALGHLEAAGLVKRGAQDVFGAHLWSVTDR